MARMRIVLCMGRDCNRGGQACPLEQVLIDKLGERGPAWRRAKEPLRWEIANCLSMCEDGPNALIYPGDLSLNHLTPENLSAVVDELLTAAEKNED